MKTPQYDLQKTRHGWAIMFAGTGDYPGGFVTAVPDEPTGRLLAASPGLLEALEALTDQDGHIWHGGNGECTGECKAVRAAITLAKGIE